MDADDLDIRPFREADADAVVALWRLCFPNDPPRNEPTAVIRRKLGTQRELFLVGVVRGRVAATALGGYDGFRGWVYHLAVHPDRRRLGIGRRLMDEIETRLRALGCPKLNLQVRATNQDVVGFYRALGYAIENHVSMGKELTS